MTSLTMSKKMKERRLTKKTKNQMIETKKKPMKKKTKT